MAVNRNGGNQPEDPAGPVSVPDTNQMVPSDLEKELHLERIKNEALKRENLEFRIMMDVLNGQLESYRDRAEHDQRTINALAKSWEEKNREAYEAQFDHITGLIMPEFFDRKVEEFFKKEKRKVRFAFGLIDLAGFKEGVNDKFGHLAGDDVLRQVGLITSSVRESHPRVEGERRYLPRRGEYDITSRGGTGDEFAFLVSEVASVPDCRYLAHRLVRGIAQVRVRDVCPVVQGDIGIVTLVMDPALLREHTVFQLRRWADYYMYKAKNYCKSQGADVQSRNHYAVKDLPIERLFQEPPLVDRSGR